MPPSFRFSSPQRPQLQFRTKSSTPLKHPYYASLLSFFFPATAIFFLIQCHFNFIHCQEQGMTGAVRSSKSKLFFIKEVIIIYMLITLIIDDFLFFQKQNWFLGFQLWRSLILSTRQTFVRLFSSQKYFLFFKKNFQFQFL